VKFMAAGLVNRRQVMVGTVTATTSVVAHAKALSSDAARLSAASRATVVLHDPRLPIDALVAQRLAANGAQVIALDDDPVRMWRGQIGALLAQPGTKLLGVTRWADFLLVRGLAAETRRHVRYERLDRESGALTWLIA
jgi:hypothetical protein